VIQENMHMKTTELRQKDVAGLEAEVKSLQKAHFGLRMQKATQQLNNNATLGNTRRAIARAKTILGEKQRAAAAK
jgi:large subunit ribosomal protein L29